VFQRHGDHGNHESLDLQGLVTGYRVFGISHTYAMDGVCDVTWDQNRGWILLTGWLVGWLVGGWLDYQSKRFMRSYLLILVPLPSSASS